jgi:hypothetical protein
MTYRLLFAYAFVRLESEQNSSHPTFPRAPHALKQTDPAATARQVEDAHYGADDERARRLTISCDRVDFS